MIALELVGLTLLAAVLIAATFGVLAYVIWDFVKTGGER